MKTLKHDYKKQFTMRIVGIVIMAVVLLCAGRANAASPWPLIDSTLDNSVGQAIDTIDNSTPAFCDIDDDGDPDMFIGRKDGRISFYRNDDEGDGPVWTFVSDYYKSIDVGDNSSPAFFDVDGDGDYDMFIGKTLGTISYYRNDDISATDGVIDGEVWVLVSSAYNSIDVGDNSVPTFYDIDGDGDDDLLISGADGKTRVYLYSLDYDDNGDPVVTFTKADNICISGSYVNARVAFSDVEGDGDYDMFVGKSNGTLSLYGNNGTEAIPLFTLTGNTFGSDVGDNNIPIFCDIDDDGDYDMFIGEATGAVTYYRNKDIESEDWDIDGPSWATGVSIGDVGDNSAPVLYDMDDDWDYDLFVGKSDGTITLFRNDDENMGSGPAVWVNVAASYGNIDVGDNSVPEFCDIDNDNDQEMFVGKAAGTISSYENDGLDEFLHWIFSELISDSTSAEIDIGANSIPTFCDIDGDGDRDMFVGKDNGQLTFYRSDPFLFGGKVWTKVSDTYNSIDIGSKSAPAFCDIDGNNVQDMFIGESDGTINFYKNTGTTSSPVWAAIVTSYSGIDVGANSVPAFCDIDGNNVQDMFIGESDGTINFYKNTGTTTSPVWAAVVPGYNGIDVGDNSIPSFYDFDGDSDYDLFVGNSAGTVACYRNDGTAASPAWTLIDNIYDGIDIGANSAPAMCNGKLYIGQSDGKISSYESCQWPKWTCVTDTYAGINVGSNSVPRFYDFDGDSDYDLFVGKGDGTVAIYRNDDNYGSGPVWTLLRTEYGDIDVVSNSAPAFCDLYDDGLSELYIGMANGYTTQYQNSDWPTYDVPVWALATDSFDGINVGANSAPVFRDVNGDLGEDMFIGKGDGTIAFYGRDTEPPTAGSISINNNAVYATTTTVTLALSATGASQMQFRNGVSYLWSNWEVYGETKLWTLLSGDGTKNVSARFKDEAGNISTEYSDTIILCTTPPVASFTANPATGISPLTVGFTSNSTGVITSQSWSFGDGGTSTQTSPSHIYTTPGKYTVSLTVTGPGGSNIKTMTDCITATSCTGTGTIVANVAFTSYPDIKIPGIEVKLWKKEAGDTEYSLYATMVTNGTGVCLFGSLPLQFPTSSTSSTSYKVKTVPQFGYAAYESSSITFYHPAWPAPGYSGLMICDVRLTRVTQNKGVMSGCVTANGQAFSPLANVNVELWKKSYGDTDFVLLQNTATNTIGGYSFIDLTEIFYHNAPQAILYKVKVAAQAGYEAYEGEQLKFYSGMSNWVDAIQQDAVLTAIPPVASFTVSPKEGPVPLTASFTNSSTGSITTYFWDFGDGTTSTDRIPSHTYTQSGTYDITLEVSGPAGSDSMTLKDCVTATRSGSIIQSLLDAAPKGGTVQLESGIYKLSSNLSIKKNVTLKGLTADNTILVLGPYSILIKDGLYLDKNEYYYQLYDNLTDVTLENLTITGYTGVSPQGPIEAYVRNYLTLKNCKLVGNKGTRVSGIYYGGTYLWTDATKTALWKTGGVKLVNTLIAGNTTEEGHGYDGPYSPDGTDANGKVIYWSKRAVIYANGGKLEVYNSTIAGNLNNSGPTKKVKYGTIILDTANLNTMVNTIMWDNPTDLYWFRNLIVNVTYSDIAQISIAGEGVINEDPLFNEGTYTVSDISPCKGTGLDGADMGARF